MKQAPFMRVLPFAIALALGACGGGGGNDSSGSTSTPSSASTTSSGAITAFGSVFVNGHEFATGTARVMDDDTGDTSGKVSALEVGEVVDVDQDSSSTSSAPVAQWLHVHPLARGYVDASDTTANTLTVMGQTVSLDSGTLFSDHRACVSATTGACTAITDATGLTVTTTGTSTTPGSYVTVDGYLFSATAGSAQIVATLVSVRDVPTSYPAAFKAEGLVTATTAAGATTGVTIGGLAVDLGSATCRVDGATTPCASAFAAGEVVSVFSTTAPTLPAAAFTATVAIERKHLPVQTAGAAVEFDGRVSTSTPASGTTAATFVVRGVTVDTSALPAGTSLPAVGDLVRVTGTVSSDGLSVTASAIKILHAARSVSYAFGGDVTAVAAGTVSGTFNVTVLGQTIVVTDQTRLSDRQSWHWEDHDPQANPFNITTFQTYLAASASQHVAVKAAKDSSGVLQALSFSIRPVSTFSEVAGPVDATPAPVAGTSSTPSTFSIDGVAVSAAAGSVHFAHDGLTAIAAGDEVAASGTFASGVLGVAATQSFDNFVIDFGPPRVGGDDVPL